MIVFPAIDLKDGKVVRLVQGKFDQVTEYSQDPVEMARHWEKEGAQWLHVVDLDGALEGKPKNFKIIQEIIQAISIPVQMGGGIRSIQAIEDLLAIKLGRAILGTRVIEDTEFRNKVVKFQNRVAVSLDCSNGMVAQRGWTSVSDKKAVDFAKELADAGFQCLIYTDIARDGMLTGPNFSGLEDILRAVKIDVIASGGVSNLEDIKRLLSIQKSFPHLKGVITGKAIYEGKLNFSDAVKLCSAKG